ncbi:MAG TPA: secretin N-terminal domain-containing protein, partial [Candidatus Acidoferrum sp.]|nr:secretin N-terminal domain-containing protein [Candidatus Acidoferrum sp.]
NPSGKISLAMDERSNSILMTGDVGKRQQMRVLIEGLDQPIAETGNTHVVYVHYMKAADLVPIVRSVVDSVYAEQRNDAKTRSTVNIEASETANALIITAPAEIMEVVKNVIDRLDIRRAQVLVEAVIVEVNQDKVDQLGVMWGSNTNAIGQDGAVGVSSTLPTALGDGLTRASNQLDVSLVGDGLTLGYYRAGSLRALLRALQSNTAANVLSTPSIVTLDNEEAEIIVGSNVPFLTGSRETLSSSSTGLFNTIERRDIGIKLKIKPQINEGDSVTLNINQSVENVTNKDQAADIQTDKRQITTKVIIFDNDTLVLGGLIKNGTTKTEVGVPILGDIPILGHLFRSKNTDNEKKNLMVFLHLTILKDQLADNRISKERYNAIRDEQVKFGESPDKIKLPKFEGVPLLPEFELYQPNLKPVPVQ